MKRAIASVGLLALGAVGVNSAHADWAAGTDKPWSLNGTLRGFYDDNYNTQPSGPGKLKSFGIEIAPGASLNYSSGPTLIKASYNYSLKDYFARPGGQLDQSHDVELLVDHAFNEANKLEFTESFVDSQEPQVLQGSGATSFPLRANSDNYRNTAAINFNTQVSRLLGFMFGYANSIYDYTGTLPPSEVNIAAPYKTSLNRVEQTFTVNSRWTIEPETTGIFGYSFESIDYISGGNLQTQAGYPFETAKTRNNYSHDIYLGLEHNFLPTLSFSGRAGVQIVDYYNGQNAPGGGTGSGAVGPFADLSLTYAYLDNGSVTLGFRQSKNQTDVGPNPNGSLTQDQESSTVYVTISQVVTPLSPRLTASLNGQFQNSVYNGGTLYNGETDDYYIFGANLSYQFTRYLSSEVGYNYTQLDSDVLGRAYTRNYVYMGVTATY